MPAVEDEITEGGDAPILFGIGDPKPGPGMGPGSPDGGGESLTFVLAKRQRTRKCLHGGVVSPAAHTAFEVADRARTDASLLCEFNLGQARSSSVHAKKASEGV